VIDFIRGFTEVESPLGSNLDSQLEATGRLLAAARQSTFPIIFTTTAYDEKLVETGLFLSKVPSLSTLKRGSDWVELDSRLERSAEELIIEKQYASAFFGTALASVLTVQRVDTLILAGSTTSGCVRATAVDALQHGYRAIVPTECVGDRAKEPHVANLLDIDAKYGDVVSLDETLSYLESLSRDS
jgi:nicotinamidase-related amidase